MFNAVNQFVKGTKAMMYRVALLEMEVSNLRKANEALSKRRRAKKMFVQHKGFLPVQNAQNLLDQQAIMEQIIQEVQQRLGKTRCCRICGKSGHNARTCQKGQKTSQEVQESSNSSIPNIN